MRDYEQLQKICLEEVIQAGIIPGPIVEWSVNRRAKTRWGLCRKERNGACRIEIAERLLTDERISEKACKETIIHEILHTCKGCVGHTGLWKQYAERMNTLYGYQIKRVTTGEEKGVENYEGKRNSVKYVYRCKRCGQTIAYRRTCKFTKYYRNYSCGICGKWRAFEQIQ